MAKHRGQYLARLRQVELAYGLAVVRESIGHTLQTKFQKLPLRLAAVYQQKHDSMLQHRAVFRELKVLCHCRW